MRVPPNPDRKRIPLLSNSIQDLLRDKPPVMVLDMGLGSRLQGFVARPPRRAYDSEPLRVIADIAGDAAENDNRPRG